jgi:hypothetical protein
LWQQLGQGLRSRRGFGGNHCLARREQGRGHGRPGRQQGRLDLDQWRQQLGHSGSRRHGQPRCGRAGTPSGGRGGNSNPGTGGTEPNGCPTTCDDGDACTTDSEGPSDAECELTCDHGVIDACVGDDDCCPAGCDQDSDSDCSPTTSGAIPPERVISWKPGIPGGIPERTQACATIDAEDFGNGEQDSTMAIQSALNSCPDNQVVQLSAGNFRTTDMLSIRKSITLRGAGPSQTKLYLDNSATGAAVRMGNYLNWITGAAVQGGLNKGSTSLTLSDASEFEVGDIAMIDQRDDPALVATGNCTWNKRMEGSTARSMGQMFEIIGKSGNTVEISSPLYMDYSLDMVPGLTKPDSAMTRRAGIEDLYINRTSAFNGQGWMIHSMFTADSWVKNVETDKVQGRHVAIESSFRNIVRDSYFHHAFSYNSGANAYGVTIANHSSDNLIENNIVYYLNIPVAFENSGGGNVFAYNYVDDAIITDGPGWQMPDINTHCSFPHMELIEGNSVAHMGTDNVHGGSGYMTFFRNQATAKHRTVPQDNNIEAVELSANSMFMNVIGNVLFSPDLQGVYDGDCRTSTAVYSMGLYLEAGNRCSFDERVGQTVLRHGNFDYLSNDVLWDDSIDSHDLPPSLYLNGKPAFFGDERWPFVEPEAAEKVGTLPARARFDALQ